MARRSVLVDFARSRKLRGSRARGWLRRGEPMDTRSSASLEGSGEVCYLLKAAGSRRGRLPRCR